MGRAPCCEKVGLKRGRWTAEEDQILTNYIQTNGEGSWRSLPKNAGLLRCGKSCRLRWINYLRGDLKRGNITAEEEETIVKLHSTFGNRWSLIAAQLPGRTDNEIKNYWNSHLSRKIYRFSKTLSNSSLTNLDTAKIVEARSRKRGRTSRSAMRKQKLALLKFSKMTKDHNDEQVVAPPHSTSEEPNKGHGGTGNEVLGPDEWLDSEIERLSVLLQGRKCKEITCGDPSFNSKENCGTKEITLEKGTNEEVMVQSTNNAESSTEEFSFSPVNSGFNEETHLVSESRGLEEDYVDWEFLGFGDQNHEQCETWDDGDLSKMLCWLWDEGKGSHL